MNAFTSTLYLERPLSPVKLGHDGEAGDAVRRQRKVADGDDLVGFVEELSSAITGAADAGSENATVRKTAADSLRNAGPVALALFDRDDFELCILELLALQEKLGALLLIGAFEADHLTFVALLEPLAVELVEPVRVPTAAGLDELDHAAAIEHRSSCDSI
jgi:hypothetical protein